MEPKNQKTEKTKIPSIPLKDLEVNQFIILQDLVSAMRARNYNLRTTAVGVALLVGTFTLLGWNQIQSWLGQRTAEVASITLEDQTIQIKVCPSHLAHPHAYWPLT